MKRLLLLMVVGVSALVGNATGQFLERIYDDGVCKGMCRLLLELDSAAFSRIESRLPQGGMDTALARKYIGCWSIKNDSLFLDSVLVRAGGLNFKPIMIDDIFAEKRTASGYFADWVWLCDSLRVVSGDIVSYTHMGWESIWEKEEFIAVESGIVKGRVCKRNRLVNPGFNQMEFRSLLDSLALEVMPGRVCLQAGYSGYDADGNPTSCRIKVVRGSGDAATDDRVVAAVEKLMLESKPLPIYYIYGQYRSDTYTIPIGWRRKKDVKQ